MDFLNPHPPYVLFRDRPEWSDVTPIPQDEGPTPPLAPILYNEKYKDATSYFRAIYTTNERSPRILDLTLEIIKQNPSHYTVWQYRLTTLLTLHSPLTDELHLLSKLLPTHLKSYQAWNHRRLVLLQLGKKAARAELAFAEIALGRDAKNYHTWVYREWLLCNFFAPKPAVSLPATTTSDSSSNDPFADPAPTADEQEPTIIELEDDTETDDLVWREELEFTDRMLADDVRNNSVWHHRYFVLFEGPRPSQDPEVVEREIEYTKRQILLAPSNQSAWSYLRGLLLRPSPSPSSHSSSSPLKPRALSSLLPFARPFTLTREKLMQFKISCSLEEREWLPGEKASLPCLQALEFVLDALAEEGEGGTVEGKREAARILEELKWRDPIRKQFWEYRRRSLGLPGGKTEAEVQGEVEGQVSSEVQA